MEAIDAKMVPVALLCGGRTVRLRDDPPRIKPLVPVLGRALILHVIEHYVRHGFRRFVLAGGHQVQDLKTLISQQSWMEGVSVQVVDTGGETSTGDRLRGLRSYLEAPIIAVSYSDTLSNIQLDNALRNFAKTKLTGQITATHLPTRFRILGIRSGESLVRGLADRPVVQNDWINGGCYFFRHAIWHQDYLGAERPGLILEDDVIGELARRLQLVAFKHEGQWHPIDCDRDLGPAEVFLKGLTHGS